MTTYETIRQSYKPDHIHILLIAESPPPPADVQSSRQFYYHDRIRTADRLFVNTIKALYESADKLTEAQIEADKEAWLKRFQADGFYIIEALDESQPHAATKQERQAKIRAHLPALLAKVRSLSMPDTKIVLIKSNVFEIAAQPLREAGFRVLNTELVDYPGQFNQRAYREKLRHLVHGPAR